MGFELLPFPGLEPFELAAARAEHVVVLSAEAAVLLEICPELLALSSSDDDGTTRLPYWPVARLGLQLLTAAGSRLEWQLELWRYVFDPSHFWPPVKACIVSSSFDSERVYSFGALAASLRLARDRMAQEGELPSSFVVAPSALLPTSRVRVDEEMDAYLARVDASADEPNGTIPTVFMATTFDVAMDDDSTFRTLAIMEVVIYPRFTMLDRRGDASGIPFMLRATAPLAFADVGGHDNDEIDWMSDLDYMRVIISFLRSRIPPVLLTAAPPSVAASRMLAVRWLRAASDSALLNLSSENVVLAVAASPFTSLRLLYGGITDGRMLLSLLTVLSQAASADAPSVLTLGSFLTLGDTAEPFGTRLTAALAEATGLLAGTGHEVGVRMLRAGRDGVGTHAHPHGPLGAPLALGETSSSLAGPLGYPRAYHDALRTRVNSELFIEVATAVMRGLGTIHVFELIKMIFRSGEMLLIYPLLGHKHTLEGWPVVSRIADELHPHGARYLGWVARELLVPGLDDDRTPPDLTGIWQQLCKFDLCFDLVNDVLYATYSYYKDEVHTRVAPSLVYAELESLRLIAPLVREETGFYWHIGFSCANGGSFGDVYDLGISYYERAVGLDMALVGGHVRDALKGVQMEKTVVFQRRMLRFAPDGEYGGPMAIPDSPAIACLERHIKELPETLKLLRQLRTVDTTRLKATLASSGPSPNTPKRPTDTTATPGVDAEKTRDEQRQAKLAAAKEMGIGKLERLAKVSDNGKVLQMGGPTAQKIDLAKFKRKHPNLCEGVMFSTHDQPYFACNHKNEPGHQTKDSGAHAFPREAKADRKAWQSLFFLTLAAAAPAPATPFAAPRRPTSASRALSLPVLTGFTLSSTRVHHATVPLPSSTFALHHGLVHDQNSDVPTDSKGMGMARSIGFAASLSPVFQCPSRSMPPSTALLTLPAVLAVVAEGSTNSAHSRLSVPPSSQMYQLPSVGLLAGGTLVMVLSLLVWAATRRSLVFFISCLVSIVSLVTARPLPLIPSTPVKLFAKHRVSPNPLLARVAWGVRLARKSGLATVCCVYLVLGMSASRPTGPSPQWVTWTNSPSMGGGWSRAGWCTHHPARAGLLAPPSASSLDCGVLLVAPLHDTPQSSDPRSNSVTILLPRPLLRPPSVTSVGAVLVASDESSFLTVAIATPLLPICALLERALEGMRGAGEVENETVIALALALGASAPRTATLAALRAALDRLASPFRPIAASELASAHGATRAAYFEWSARLRELREFCEAVALVYDDVASVPSVPPTSTSAAQSAQPHALRSRGGALPTLPAVSSDVASPSLVLLPLARILLPDGSAVPAVGLPAACNPSSMINESLSVTFWGQVRERQHRDDDDHTAKEWTSTLFGDTHAFYLMETRSPPVRVVHATPRGDRSLPHLPYEEEGSRMHAGARDMSSVLWVEIAKLPSEVRLLLEQACLRLESHVKPTTYVPHCLRTGALAPQRLQPQQLLVHGRHTRIAWDSGPNSVVANSIRVVAILRKAFQRAVLSAQEAGDAELAAELEGWLDALRPPPLDEVPTELHACALQSHDQRLVATPFPHHAVPVATPPLPPRPPPPPMGVIPGWASAIHHAIRPQAYHLLWHLMVASRAHLRAVWQRALGWEGPFPHKPPFVALPPSIFQAWAEPQVRAGEILMFGDGHLYFLDRSLSPPTHFGRQYIAENVTHNSSDCALKDAILTHGIVITPKSKLPPLVVIQQNMDSIADGFTTVHSELDKMKRREWYRQCADKLDEGLLTFECLPAWFNPNGSVPRALSEVYRRILDGFAPRMPEYVMIMDRFWSVPMRPAEALLRTPPPLLAVIRRVLRMRSYRETSFADKTQPVSSVNAAAGMTESRAANRALAAKESEARIRCSTAQRRRERAVQLDSKGVAVPPPMAPEASFPQELKAFFADLMLAHALLVYIVYLIPGEAVVVFSDDFKSHFHQFSYSFCSRWMFHLLALDPSDVAAGLAGTAALAVFAEQCMGMGIGPASNYAQRFSTELADSYVTRFHELEAPYIALIEKSNPDFAVYAEKRRALARTTGRLELLVLVLMIFTDDPIALLLMGIDGERAVRAVTLWWNHAGPRGVNLLMGEPIKRYFGVHAPWIGGNILTTANLAYMSHDKRLRAQVQLGSFLAGGMQVQEIKRMNGLLEHVAAICALPHYVMNHMYDTIDAARRASGGREPEPTCVPVPTPDNLRAANRWMKALCTRSGASVFAAVFEVSMPHANVTWVLRCDAAVEGTAWPGICGCLYSLYYIYQLTPLTKTLPIAALEFAGQGFFNLHVYDPHLPPFVEILLAGDALVAALAVARGPRESLLLRYMHAELVSSEVFQKREEQLSGCQEYGVGNPLCDHGSRGRVKEMLELMRRLGLQPRELAVPQVCVEFLERAARFWLMLGGAQAVAACQDEAVVSDDHKSHFHQFCAPHHYARAASLPWELAMWALIFACTFAVAAAVGAWVLRRPDIISSHRTLSQPTAWYSPAPALLQVMGELRWSYSPALLQAMEELRWSEFARREYMASPHSQDPHAMLLGVSVDRAYGSLPSTEHLATQLLAAVLYMERDPTATLLLLRAVDTSLCDAADLLCVPYFGRLGRHIYCRSQQRWAAQWEAAESASHGEPEAPLIPVPQGYRCTLCRSNPCVCDYIEPEFESGTLSHLEELQVPVREHVWFWCRVCRSIPCVCEYIEPDESGTLSYLENLPVSVLGLVCEHLHYGPAWPLEGTISLLALGECSHALLYATVVATDTWFMESLLPRVVEVPPCPLPPAGDAAYGRALREFAAEYAEPFDCDPFNLECPDRVAGCRCGTIMDDFQACLREGVFDTTVCQSASEDGSESEDEVRAPACAVCELAPCACVAPAAMRMLFWMVTLSFLPRGLAASTAGSVVPPLSYFGFAGVSLACVAIVMGVLVLSVLSRDLLPRGWAWATSRHPPLRGQCQACCQLTSRRCSLGADEWYCDEECELYDRHAHFHRTGGECGICTCAPQFPTLGAAVARRVQPRGMRTWLLACVFLLGCASVEPMSIEEPSAAARNRQPPSILRLSLRPTLTYPSYNLMPRGAIRHVPQRPAPQARPRSPQPSRRSFGTQTERSALRPPKSTSCPSPRVHTARKPSLPSAPRVAAANPSRGPSRDAVDRPANPHRTPPPPRPGSSPSPAAGAADAAVRDGPSLRDGWEAALANDDSSFALCPGDPLRLARVLEQVRGHIERSFAVSTNAKDGYHLRAWARVCAELGTPMWRTDVAANSGLDPVGHRRELILLAVALVMLYARMRPRSRRDPVANPRNALQKLRAVAREHRKRGYQMAPLTLAVSVMKGMLRLAVELHDTDWLSPARKRPLTNAMIWAMLSVEAGVSGMGFTVVPTAYLWVSVFATFAVLAETGMRKADVSKATARTAFAKGRLTFGKLTWEIDGVQHAYLTRAQLLGARPGYACYLVYGALKNDPFAEFYGSRPSKLTFADSPRNACKRLVELELHAAVAPEARSRTPLFGPKPGAEWHHGLLDKLFLFLLTHACGLTPSEAGAYSVHSFRIYLACALYAAGCPNDRIQAILRWKSEEALLIYARLNDSERTQWITKASCALVDSTVAAHLPTIDGADIAAALLAHEVDEETVEEDGATA